MVDKAFELDSERWPEAQRSHERKGAHVVDVPLDLWGRFLYGVRIERPKRIILCVPENAC